MTNAKNFLRKRLNEIFVAIDNIEIAYEHRLTTNTHIIEVKPNSVFKESKAYADMEMALEEEFEQMFPEEELLFISENSLTQLEQPEFKFSVKLKYALKTKTSALISTSADKMIDEKVSYALAA